MLDWTRETGKSVNRVVGLSGSVHMFTISWDIAANNKEGPWVLYCDLPGNKPVLGNFPSIEEAQERAEGALKRWLWRANIMPGWEEEEPDGQN